MRRRSGPFDKDAGSAPLAHLDAARLVQGPFAWLTPNRLVIASRVALVMLLLIALIPGPGGLGTVELRFMIAYGVTLVAIPAFPRIGGRNIGGAIALMLGARWVFSTWDEATAEMLLTQLAGVACALAPIYARNVGRLAGSSEGYISFTERRAMWQQRAAGTARPTAPVRQSPQPAPAAPTIALLDYRPTVRD